MDDGEESLTFVLWGALFRFHFAIGVCLSTHFLQIRWFEGPHLLKCMARIVEIVQDQDQRNALVRLADTNKIIRFLVDTTASDFHPFLRRPIQILVEMLQFTRMLTIVADSEDPVVLAGVGTEETVDSISSLSDELQQSVLRIQRADQEIWRVTSSLRMPTSGHGEAQRAAAVNALRPIVEQLGVSPSGVDSVWNESSLRELFRTSRCVSRHGTKCLLTA